MTDASEFLHLKNAAMLARWNSGVAAETCHAMTDGTSEFSLRELHDTQHQISLFRSPTLALTRVRLRTSRCTLC